MEPPPVVVEEGWSPLPPMTARSGRSYVLGAAGDDRMRVAYFQRARDGALVARVWFGPWCEGPPGHAHGGSMAAILDDALGKVGWLAGRRVVAARIAVNFRRLLPLGTDAVLEAWVDRQEGRKVFTRAHLLGADGDPFADAEGLFIELDEESQKRLAKE